MLKTLKAELNETKPLIHVVDDDKKMLDTLSSLFLLEDFEVKTYETAESFISEDLEIRPGCILLDYKLPGKSGLDIQAVINSRNIPIPVVFLSGEAEVDEAVIALQHGAINFLTKPAKTNDLLDVTHMSVQKSIQFIIKHHISNLLSKREQEVAHLLTKARTNKQIALELDLSTRTVEFHRKNLLQKLEIIDVSTLHDYFKTP